jgi:hypothetical protein
MRGRTARMMGAARLGDESLTSRKLPIQAPEPRLVWLRGGPVPVTHGGAQLVHETVDVAEQDRCHVAADPLQQSGQMLPLHVDYGSKPESPSAAV